MSQVIYKIINLVNDKFYVGSTNNKNERFRTHRNKLRRGVHHCAHLQASWNKYGEEKFDFRVVQNVPDEESLQAAEDVWLVEHVGKQHCYNAGTRSGAPMRGRTGEKHPSFGVPVSEEQREQISQTLKGFYAQDYFNHPRVGKQHTEETKAKISASKKANPIAYWAGKERSEETRAKISAAQKGREGRKFTDAEREAIRQRTLGNKNFLGKTHTEEAKAKLRRPIYALLPDGTRRDFIGVSAAGEELNVAYPMLLRACKVGKPINRGMFAGWQFFYADQEAAPVHIPEEFKHLPRTRQDAKAQGAKEYFTGMPCTHGHISPRLAKGSCVACQKEEWTKRNAALRLEVAYSHSPQYTATLVQIYTDAAPANQSQWPKSLVYKGYRWGRHEVATDVYSMPEDLETALCLLLRGQASELYWSEAKKWFPPEVVWQLRGIDQDRIA